MGQISRHDVADQITEFKKLLALTKPTIGNGDTVYAGIQMVEHEFSRESGTPSVRLRNYARVLKHYNELPKDVANIRLANTALMSVRQGIDPTKAVKRARTECAQKNAQTDKQLKQLSEWLSSRELAA